MKANPKIHILDLQFLDKSNSIATHLVESSDGPVIIDCGPETTYEHLAKAITDAGFDPKDVKHLLLTHIHFDHAGAAWKFAQAGAKVYVHPIGLPHMNSPERLWNSAAMIYGDDMDRLWGKMEPIPGSNLVAVNDGDTIRIGDLEFTAHYTPGHAVHHNAYQLGDVVFTGDVAGVRIMGGPVVPPCPPPDIDLGLWKKSIAKLRELNPKRMYPAHFGAVDDVTKHLADLEVMLDDWANWMKPYYDNKTPADDITPKFMEYTKNQLLEAGLDEDDIIRYEYANPSWMSVAGLLRYWKLKEQGRI